MNDDAMVVCLMVVRTRFYLKKEVVSDNIAVYFVEANVDCVRYYEEKGV